MSFSESKLLNFLIDDAASIGKHVLLIVDEIMVGTKCVKIFSKCINPSDNFSKKKIVAQTRLTIFIQNYKWESNDDKLQQPAQLIPVPMSHITKDKHFDRSIVTNVSSQ